MLKDDSEWQFNNKKSSGKIDERSQIAKSDVTPGIKNSKLGKSEGQSHPWDRDGKWVVL